MFVLGQNKQGNLIFVNFPGGMPGAVGSVAASQLPV